MIVIDDYKLINTIKTKLNLFNIECKKISNNNDVIKITNYKKYVLSNENFCVILFTKINGIDNIYIYDLYNEIFYYIHLDLSYKYNKDKIYYGIYDKNNVYIINNDLKINDTKFNSIHLIKKMENLCSTKNKTSTKLIFINENEIYNIQKTFIKKDNFIINIGKKIYNKYNEEILCEYLINNRKIQNKLDLIKDEQINENCKCICQFDEIKQIWKKIE